MCQFRHLGENLGSSACQPTAILYISLELSYAHRMPILKRAILIAVLLLPFHSPLRAAEAPTDERIQLAQSIPAETKLAHPDILFAKDVWIEMIREARKTIDLAQFYVASQPGDAIEPVLEELEKAAAGGVKIRLLVSNVLLEQDPLTLERFRKMKNAEVRVMNLSKLTKGILHAKYWVIDGREIFVGSQNFDWRALAHIHETGARIRDAKIARSLARIFELDWAYSESGRYPKPVHSAARAASGDIELVSSPPELNPPGIRPAIDALLQLISNSRKSIRIQLLDYSPLSGKSEFWPEVDNALRSAALRGVRVQLLVSNWNTGEAEIPHLKSLSLLPNVEIRIVTIPEHSSGFIPFARVAHSKYMVVDDAILWLGTSNWSRGYFYASRNVELILKSPLPAGQGAQIFDRLWNDPVSAKIDVTKTYVPPKKG